MEAKARGTDADSLRGVGPQGRAGELRARGARAGGKRTAHPQQERRGGEGRACCSCHTGPSLVTTTIPTMATRGTLLLVGLCINQ